MTVVSRFFAVLLSISKAGSGTDSWGELTENLIVFFHKNLCCVDDGKSDKAGQPIVNDGLRMLTHAGCSVRSSVSFGNGQSRQRTFKSKIRSFRFILVSSCIRNPCVV